MTVESSFQNCTVSKYLNVFKNLILHIKRAISNHIRKKKQHALYVYMHIFYMVDVGTIQQYDRNGQNSTKVQQFWKTW